MLRSLSAEEVTAWQLYEHMEPFGERAEYVRSAATCALLDNLLRPRKKGDQAATVADFMPDTFKEEKTPRESDPREAMFALAAAMGAKVVKRGESS